jgi:hypothetical protein
MESLDEMIDCIRELMYCKKFVVVETFQCQGPLAFLSRSEANGRFCGKIAGKTKHNHVRIQLVSQLACWLRGRPVPQHT